MLCSMHVYIWIIMFVGELMCGCHGAAIQHRPLDTSTPPPSSAPVNCSGLLIASPAASSQGAKAHNPPADLAQNCSDGSGADITVTKPGSDYSYWKNNVIVACTIAAATEVVIVVVIVLYWKQIRWTLRKITCPCTSHSEATTEQQDVNETPNQEEVRGDEVTDLQSFSSARHGRDSEDEIDSHDLDPHLDQRSGVMEYEDFMSRDSSSVDGHSHTARRFIAGHKPDSMSYVSAINYYQIPSECGSSVGPAEDASSVGAKTNVEPHRDPHCLDQTSLASYKETSSKRHSRHSENSGGGPQLSVNTASQLLPEQEPSRPAAQPETSSLLQMA